MPVFLKMLRTMPNVRAACKAAGIARGTAYAARRDVPEFAKAWNHAIDDALDRLEAAAWDKAMSGQSDTLTIFLLKVHRYHDAAFGYPQQQLSEHWPKLGLGRSWSG